MHAERCWDLLCVWGVQKGRFANLANNLPKWYNLVRHGYKAPDPRLFQHRPTACCETASRFVVSAAAVAPPPSPLEVALSHPADAFHRPPTPTGTHPHTTGGYTPANTRQQCQNIGGDGQETAGGCRRSRGAGWRSGSPVDCCRGHGAALATEMSTRRAFGGRPREPAASVRRSEALAADGGWARRPWTIQEEEVEVPWPDLLCLVQLCKQALHKHVRYRARIDAYRMNRDQHDCRRANPERNRSYDL